MFLFEMFDKIVESKNGGFEFGEFFIQMPRNDTEAEQMSHSMGAAGMEPYIEDALLSNDPEIFRNATLDLQMIMPNIENHLMNNVMSEQFVNMFMSEINEIYDWVSGGYKKNLKFKDGKWHDITYGDEDDEHPEGKDRFNWGEPEKEPYFDMQGAQESVNEEQLDESIFQDVLSFLWNATGKLLDKLPGIGAKREEARLKNEYDNFVNTMDEETTNKWIAELVSKLKSTHHATERAKEHRITVLRNNIERVKSSKNANDFRINMDHLRRSLTELKKFVTKSNKGVAARKRKARAVTESTGMQLYMVRCVGNFWGGKYYETGVDSVVVAAGSPEEAVQIAKDNIDAVVDHFHNKRIGPRKRPALRAKDNKVRVTDTAKPMKQTSFHKVLSSNGTFGPVDVANSVNEAKKPTKWDLLTKCPECGGKLETGYRGWTPSKRCTKCGWEKEDPRGSQTFESINEGPIDALGRTLKVKTTKSIPRERHAPKWAKFVGQTPEGAWHWLSNKTPLETPDSDQYFPLAQKTEFSGFESTPGKGMVIPVKALAESELNEAEGEATITDKQQATIDRLRKAGGNIYSDVIYSDDAGNTAYVGRNGNRFFVIYPDGTFDSGKGDFKNIRGREGYSVEYATSPPKPKRPTIASRLQDAGLDLSAVADQIQNAVGMSFPDGDPFDYLMKYARQAESAGFELMDVLNMAAKKHLRAKSYDDYLSTVWDQYAADNPDFDQENPWRESLGEAEEYVDDYTQVADMLYNQRPDLFTQHGDEYVMGFIDDMLKQGEYTDPKEVVAAIIQKLDR